MWEPARVVGVRAVGKIWLWAVLVCGMTCGAAILPTGAAADESSLMSIIPPAGAWQSADNTPLYPTRSLTFTVAQDDTTYPGDTMQCRLESSTGLASPSPTYSYTPWGSCGAPAGGSCPLSECFSYAPAITVDGSFSIFTRLVGSDGTEEYGARESEFDFAVDTARPDTQLQLDYLDGRSPGGRAADPSFTFSSDNDFATFQCSVNASGAKPGIWKACKSGRPIPFKLALTTQIFQFSVRAVDQFGRPDPTPTSTTFSPKPCRARLLTRPRTLLALTHGMRVRITCVEPSSWHFYIEPDTRLARRLEIYELGGYTGIIRHWGGSRTIRVRAFALGNFPPAFADRPLPVTYVTAPYTDEYLGYGSPQRIPGRLQ